MALRTEWRLRNLLPDHGMMEYCPACYDEEDFRARTNTKRTEWSDNAVVRVLVRVVAGVEVEFKAVYVLLAKPTAIVYNTIKKEARCHDFLPARRCASGAIMASV